MHEVHIHFHINVFLFLFCFLALLLFCFFFFLFFFKIYLFYVYEYTVAVLRHQKRTSGPITDACEPPCGCWELNSGPLESELDFRAISALNH